MKQWKSRYPDSAKRLLEQVRALSGPEVFVGPSTFRRFLCPETCVACCLVKFTLDFLPVEPEWQALPDEVKAQFTAREVAGKTVWTLQKGPKPPFLREGKCLLWPNLPLSCAAPPQVQVCVRRDHRGARVLGKIFGRAWQWPASQRPQCTFLPELGDVRKRLAILERFQRWADYFEVPTVLPALLRYLRQKSGWAWPLPSLRLVVVGGEVEVWEGQEFQGRLPLKP